MKTFLKIFGLITALVILFPVAMARAQDDSSVSFQTFYDQLSSQGNWVNTSDYGYVFQPNTSDPNWQPYTYGHWVNTDDGMMWDSDEAFGWATYHYGRWVNLAGQGWVWVPGYTWAPAWVSWRDGDDDVGWAPLPPDTSVGIDYFDPGIDLGFGFFGFGFHIGGDCDQAYDIGPACYNFCPVAYIGDRDAWRHFRDRRNNFALIGRTQNVTNINVSHDRRAGHFGRVQANGPSVAALNARSRTPIRQASLTQASTLASNGRVHGNSLSVFAPNVTSANGTNARPRSVSATLAQTSVNRGTNINDPLAVNSHLRGTRPTSAQINAATQAQSQVSTNAKIATANTQPTRPLRQSLTSLHPNAAGTGVRSATSAGGGVTPNTGTTHAAVSPSTESRFTGEAATRHAAVSPSAESRFTGVPVTRHMTTSPAAESRFTGESAHQAITPSRSFPTSSSVHPFTSSAPSYQPPHVSHTSSAPVFHSQPSFQSSAPVFHQSAPAYHPQPSVRSFAPAPAPHFSGGAPAAHFSGGNPGGGGRPSGGSGAAHASSGGGQTGNAGQRQHQ